MTEKRDISIIGGMAADIEGRPYQPLVKGDSNPGKVEMAYGGVGRNISENLGRMGQSIRFVSVAGKDSYGLGGLELLKQAGVDTSAIRLLEDESTAIYLSILDNLGDMELAICNMDILERISPEFIDEATDQVLGSRMVGLDGNLTAETMDYATRKLEGIPLFLDPVSAAKAVRAKDIVGRFHTIKPNRIEAEILSGLTIRTDADLERTGEWFLRQGVKRVFISLGSGGVFYMEDGDGGVDSGIIAPKKVSITSATGAGDAFSAAILRGYVLGQNARTTAQYGMAAASIAMESKTAVNSAMSEVLLEQRHAELYG